MTTLRTSGMLHPRVMLIPWLAAFVTLAPLLFASPLHAQSRSAKTQVRNVAVLPIAGPNGAKIRSGLAKSMLRLKNKVKVISSDKVDGAASQLGADLTSAQGKVAVARQLQIAAFIDGEVQKQGKVNASLELRVYDGRTGDEVGSMTIKGKANAIERLARARFWGKLGRTILVKTKAPPKQAPQENVRAQPKPSKAQPEEELEEEEETPRSARRGAAATEDEEDLGDETPGRSSDEALAENEPAHEETAALNALELGVRLKVMTRSYSYNEPVGAIAQHDLLPTPAFRLEARWYPGAHFTSGALANLGLDVYYQYMYPVDATAEKIGNFPTSSSALGIAARYRLPISRHELGLLAGYSNLSFDFDDAPTAVAQVPSVSYGAIKLGGDFRFALTDSVSLGAYAAYLIVRGFGELSSPTWFPHTTGSGLDLELRGGYKLSTSLEATATFGMTLYAMSLNPKMTDQSAMPNAASPRIAGGVSDQYFNGGLGITWRP